MKMFKWLIAAFAAISLSVGNVPFVYATCANTDIECFTVGGTQKYRVSTDGNVEAAGTMAVTGATTVTGPLVASSTATITGKTIYTRTTSGTVASTASIVPTSTFYVVLTTANAGAILMSSTPNIATGNATDGQYLVIKGTSSVSTITLQDAGTLASSGLELGAASRIISDKKVLTLIYDSVTAAWIEVSYGNN